MPTTVLDEPTWRAKLAAHQARVDGWLLDHLERRRRGITHPAQDFLFQYYFYRPRQLRRWHPGAAIALRGADIEEFGHDYLDSADGVIVDAARLTRQRARLIDEIRRLLEGTASRVPNLGCFGMHEWAMVYRQSPQELRHHGWPLRLTSDEVADVVDAQALRCSHVDAYRFFTEPAKQLNLLVPTRASQSRLEQPGCLHANMDLYKWAYKLSPLVPSELVADCFELARDIRTLDMRASPYDLTALGYSPVRIETIEGRSEYVQAQRSFADRAAPLRARLIDECERFFFVDREAESATDGEP